MIKYTIYLLVFVLGLTPSCASKHKANASVDNYELKAIIEQITHISKGRLTQQDFRGWHFEFKNLPSPYSGECVAWKKTIYLDVHYWSWATETSRMELVMHEVGHCLLGRYHTNPNNSFWHDVIIKLGLIPNSGYLSDGCPTSYMHPIEVSLSCSFKHKKYYDDELFGRTDAFQYEKILGKNNGTLQAD